MDKEMFRKLSPELAHTIERDHYDFLTTDTLPKLAEAWPLACVLVRCHTYRFVVVAAQASAAIEAQGENLRDVSMLAGYWSTMLHNRALGNNEPARSAVSRLLEQADAYTRWAQDSTSQSNSDKYRALADAWRTAARMVSESGVNFGND